jgi:four helix bundle protein
VGTWEGGNVGRSEATAPEPGDEALACFGSGASRRSPVLRFEDLRVWQSARRLARGIYRAARTQALKDDYALREQMKRAVVSIGSNIAEGYERGTRKQHIEGCYLAKGSAGELRSQLITAHDVGLLDERAFAWLYKVCEQCSQQLAMYVARLQRTQSRIRGSKYTSPDAKRRFRSAEGESQPSGNSSPSHVPTFPPSHSSGATDEPI